MKTDVLVIGGGPAGAVTALTVKKNYPEKKVVLIKKDENCLIPCGIPYIFGTLPSVESDCMPNKPLEEKGIELVFESVEKIDSKSKKVLTAKKKEIGYDKLVLATGSVVVKPPIKGIELDKVFFVEKSMKNIENLKNAAGKAENIVIIGGGFIGVEIADELCKRGKKVSIVEAVPCLLQQAFDEEFCKTVEQRLKKLGIKIYTSTMAKEITGNKKVKGIKLSGKQSKTLKSDLVIVCVGAKPNSLLAEKAGIELGTGKGIIVDEYMRTSKKDIFAVGDCAEKKSFFTRQVSNVMLASTAASEARIAGNNLFQFRVIRQNKGTIAIFSTFVAGIGLAAAGLTESEAKRQCFEYVTGKAVAKDMHPGCLSGSSELKVKMVFSKDSGVLLGCQAMGGKAVGELINLAGFAIQNNATISEISTLQIGTHPLLTPAPTNHPFVLAAEAAMAKL